ncbi:Uncharacterised protein [Enterobacter hormaechei]|jgi:hypothetical protein|uniref:Uncharacterized protein n=1 Tax=Citrobacter freundii TaxID=546 RepID=A0AB33H4D4_CITFR|nr:MULTISPECIES: hypothetical protein [Enterobacteriaceae]EJG2168523.1 hypothetical protein [Citrobacter freundii 47N]HAT7505398.1 hypothetical protein [Citrobacter braakii]HCJ6304048.1 hypothetical protein [Enterobacter hormaechei subsp. xiangfangensis]AKZ85330.1 hypothetical protein LI65_017280 [Enterobacter hormaechei subsp. steigerwaltii]AXZ48603.1 hypothetical protein AM363_17530 [Citrobacter freundii]
MKFKLISGNRTIDSVAYDLALSIASKETSTTTPALVLAKVMELMPECIKLVSEKASEESKLKTGKVRPLVL